MLTSYNLIFAFEAKLMPFESSFYVDIIEKMYIYIFNQFISCRVDCMDFARYCHNGPRNIRSENPNENFRLTSLHLTLNVETKCRIPLQ